MEVNGRIDREKMSSTILEEDQEGVSIYWDDILFMDLEKGSSKTCWLTIYGWM